MPNGKLKILAIDTTTLRGSVALTDGPNIVAMMGIFSGKDHSMTLISSIDFLLNKMGLPLERVDAFAVASGPGSFTGIRIGLATAKGFAETLHKKIVPIVALEALAFKARFLEGLICPMIDAQRGQIYTSLYLSEGSAFRQTANDVAIRPKEWIDSLPQRKIYFLGDAAYKYSELILAQNVKDWRIIKMNLFLAEAIAELAYEKLSEGSEMLPQDVDGYYIRPSDAELAKKP